MAGFNSVCGADPGGCGRPCDLRQVPAVHGVHVLEGAPDPVHRQSAGLPCCATETSPTVLLCRRPARSHRCCSWTRLVTPVVVQRQVLGVDSAEKCGISAVAVLTKWSMSLLAQFIDGYGRRCDHAATSGLLLEVPQTQFIARVRGHSCCTTETVTMLSAVLVMAAMKGFFVLLGRFFALVRVVPELSASF